MKTNEARERGPENEVHESEVHESEAQEDESPARDESLERLLDQVESPAVSPEAARAQAEVPPGLRMARVLSMKEGGVQIAWRGRPASVEAELAEGVDGELIARAMKNGDAVLVEVDPVEGPLVVGVVQTRIPETLELKANRIVIEGESEVLLRAGTAAVRLREDGDVEMVGSRILSMSRGLYRIVGRVLRLN